MKRTHAWLILIFILCAATTATYGEDTGAWVISNHVDRFSDKNEPTFSLRARSVSAPNNLEGIRVTLLLLCPFMDFKDGKKPFRFTTGMIIFAPKITLFQAFLRYRFDDRKPGEYYDPNVHDSVLLGNLGFKEFVATLSKSKKLLIRVSSKTVGIIEAEFDLAGSEAAVKKFHSACGPIG
jgi:hypothetical protein